jgi:phospholipid/cholesterol/gamma-HCH transport system substrate-binding protein
MKSTSYTRTIIVGIFIFIGIVIFILAVFTLGSQHKTFEKSIIVKAVFSDVNGLQKGNNVWFAGVKVGTINKVILAGNERVQVDINLDKKSHQFIPKDALAKVSTDGLIGNKIVVIYGGTSKMPIENGDVLEVQKLKSTEEMLNTLSKNNDNLLQITNDFKLITKRIADGNGTVGKLLSDETLVNELNATAASLHKVSENIQVLTANTASYTAKLNAKGSLANDLVTDTVIFSSLRSTVTQLQNVAAASDSVINNLKTTSTNLGNSLNNKNAPIGMLLNDEQAAANLKLTLQNLRSGSKKLDEDLEAIQHNFLFRGFFKKKAKREQAAADTVIIIK